MKPPALSLARNALTNARNVQRSQAKGLVVDKNVTGLSEVRDVLQAKENILAYEIIDDEVHITQGGYFLKSFLKMCDFRWNKAEAQWQKQITAQDNIAAIHNDLAEIAKEWGFKLVRSE